MHVENLGQSGSDSKLGIVQQIRIANLGRVVRLFQRHSFQFIGSDWQIDFDCEAAMLIICLFEL